MASKYFYSNFEFAHGFNDKFCCTKMPLNNLFCYRRFAVHVSTFHKGVQSVAVFNL